MKENEISYEIRKAIFEVYNQLGPGLLESIYESALTYQLRKQGLKVESQRRVDILYDGVALPDPLFLDIIVDDLVIIELKSVESLMAVHYKQLRTYLKLSDRKLGILVNFNTSDISRSIARVVNGLE